jgi:hypothetical protein
MLSTIKNFFTKGYGVKSGSISHSGASFLLLDPAKVITELKVRENAEINGRANIPGPQSLDNDPFEESIRAHIKALEVDQGTIYSRRVEGYRAALNNLANDLDVQSLRAKAHHLFQVAEGSVVKAEALIFSLKQEYINAQRQYDDFKRDNNLERIAVRNQDNKFLKAGIVSVLILIETIINGAFFAQGVAGGLIGAGGIAAALAILNLAGSFVFGWKILPHKNSKEASNKLFALTMLLIYGFLVVLLNLAVGHYREVTIAVGNSPDVVNENVGILALARLTAGAFGLEDLQSWYLFAIGLIFAAVAVLDGYGFDDPYPGFGEVWRSYIKVSDRLKEAIIGEIEFLEDHFEELDQEFQSRLNSIGTKRQIFDSYIQKIENIKREYQAAQSQFVTVYMAVISEYRYINKKFRVDAVPPYFEVPPTYERAFGMENSISETFLNTINTTLESAREEIPKLISEIRDNHSSLRSRIPTFEGLIENVK